MDSHTTFGRRPLFPPTSSLARFPSPFTETHVGAVNDLLTRTYAHLHDSAFSTPTDRIARNYTPTALGLTMKQMLTRLADKAKVDGIAGSAGSGAAHAGVSAPTHTGTHTQTVGRTGGIGKGPALSTDRPSGVGSGPLPHGGGFPKPVTVISVPRKRASVAGRLSPLRAHTGTHTHTGLAASQSDSALHRIKADALAANHSLEEDIRRRYDFDEATADAVAFHELQGYWHAVDARAPDALLPDHRPEWEDGIIARLASGAAVGGIRRWKNPDLVIPAYLMDRYGPAAFAPPPPPASPAVLVEAMFAEVARYYVAAVKRAMVDYDLRSPNAEHHHGLTLHVVDSLRYVNRPVFTRQDALASYTSMPFAGLRLARALGTNESVLLQLMNMWFAPRATQQVTGAAPTPMTVPVSYSSTALSVFNTPDFHRQMPMTSEELTTAVDAQIDKALSVLRGQWHKEAAEVVAAFVLKVEDAVRARRAAQASSAGGEEDAGSSLQTSRAGTLAVSPAAPSQLGRSASSTASIAAVVDDLIMAFPSTADALRFAVELVRGELWAAGMAPGQEDSVADQVGMDLYEAAGATAEDTNGTGAHGTLKRNFSNVDTTSGSPRGGMPSSMRKLPSLARASSAAALATPAHSRSPVVLSRMPSGFPVGPAADLDAAAAAEDRAAITDALASRDQAILALTTHAPAEWLLETDGRATSPVPDGGKALAHHGGTDSRSPSRAGASGSGAQAYAAGRALALSAAASTRILPPLSVLCQLRPVDIRALMERLLVAAESPDDALARRLQTVFASVAVLMSTCLQQVVYRAIEDFTQLMQLYTRVSSLALLPGAEKDKTGAARTGNPAHRSADARSSFSNARFDSKPLLDAHSALVPFAAPLLRMSVAIFFGEGSSSAGADLVATDTDEPASRDSRVSGDGSRPGSGAAVGSGTAAARRRRGSVNTERTLSRRQSSESGASRKEMKAGGSAAPVYSSPAQQAAAAALEAAVGDIATPSKPTAGEELAKLWAGEVSVGFEPSWDAVAATLTRNVEGLVTACAAFPRVESDIAAASGVAPAADGVAKRRSGTEPQKATRQTLLDIMSTRGALSSVTHEDVAVAAARDAIARVVHINRVAPEALRSRFDAFVYLFSAAEKARVLAFARNPANTVDNFRAELFAYDEIIAAIDRVCDDMVVFPFVVVSAAPIKDALKSRVRLLCTLLMRHMKALLIHTCETVNARYTRISRKLLFKPSTSEELVVLHHFVHHLYDDLRSLEKVMYGPNGACDIVRLLHNEGLLREYQRAQPGSIPAAGPASVTAEVAPVLAAQGGGPRRNSLTGQHAMGELEGLPLSRAQCAILKDALTWPEKIRQDIGICNGVLDAEKTALVDKLAFRVAEFQKDMTETKHAMERLAHESAMNKVQTVTASIKTVQARLEAAAQEAEAINQQQDLLEQAVIDYSTDIKEAQARLAPFDRMWQIVGNYLTDSAKWYDSPLLANNADEAVKSADGMKLSAAKVLRELPEDATGPRALLTKVRDDLEQFINVEHPLLALLANPGLKDRHWASMEAAVGFDIPHTASSTLTDMLDLKLEQHIEQIEEFCVNASKEYSLERALDRMESEWQPVSLELKSHATSGTYILTGASSEEIQMLLDDHIVKSTTMAASRYAKALEARIKDWAAALIETQSVLDVWLKVQSTWLYLAPIFSSEDIMHQMPTEGARFQTVDGTWRTLMRGAVADPRALHALRQPGMLDKLNEAHSLLELILKGLNEYLEAKRLIFPRFFFLSNDELLEILAETKDPLRVQPHLRKCFEGINALQFDAGMNIMGMVSAEGERVSFTPAPDAGGKLINPASAKGNVELWLLQVEAAMKRACARVIDEACRTYARAESRSQWSLQWPAQAVLAATQMYWTNEVEAALRSLKPSALLDYAKRYTAQIEEVIMLVRGNLSALDRKTLGALVVLDVHSRDVTMQLAQAGTSSVSDFGWNSQLRYYWADDGVSANSGKPGSLTMKMINASLKYGYEYLGNTTRLVITPLTDRCYRTLMGAVHLGLGGAPEGPAGTGKTETVKDLAKAIAIQCVVFNCSDGLDYLAMAKFFKGLASSGAWSCFDEFNRIELEVLSVIAQQVLTIQQGIRERRETFVFEGTELKLNPTCSVFITMNPGYAGRSELPDNLKALFRSVAMMVPDYRMIAEIILYSYGYLDARPLAAKIVATYKLCSEQLSSQDHYDYGMRAVMAVLRAAGNLKRNEGHLPEDVLVLRSIVDVNMPKFLQPDVPLFNAIVRDLFPGVEVPPPDRVQLMDAMKAACFELRVQPVPVLLEKTLQVYEMMIVRHGFMMVGQPFSGKTTAAKVLQGAMRRLHESAPEDPRWSDIHHVVINPKAISSGALYGRFDDLTHEWTDGVLALKFRECVQNRVAAEKDRKWLMFDGPVDAVWIENMNTVLDDNKKLCLTSGEIIAMTDVMSMVFEVQDLAAASPATVSRCGMIYMEPQTLGWQPLVSSWLDHVAEDNPHFPFHAAHPSDPAARARQEKEERAFFEAADRAAAEEEAAGKRVGKRKTALVNTDSRIWTMDRATRVQLQGLFDWLVEPCLVFMRRGGVQEYCPTQDTMLVATLISVLDSCITQLVLGETAEGQPGYTVGTLKAAGRAEPTAADYENLFLFSLVWSLGASATAAGRAQLTEFVQSAARDGSYLSKHPLQPFFAARGWRAPGTASPEGPRSPYDKLDICLPGSIPQKGLIHDYFYSSVEGRWREWSSVMSRADIPPGMQYADVIVPTIYTVQFEYLVQLLLSRRQNVLVCGPTGTGKSAYMKRMLLQTLPRETTMPVFVAFSARTSAAATQGMIDVKLERRRKGVYGPPASQTCIIFVDDLNLPEPEKYGAQPPLELLRQLADSGGWYDLQENEFKHIEDSVLAAAMGPPGGGRNHISNRLLRHFRLLCFPELDDGTLTHIFGTVMDWFMGRSRFAAEVSRLSSVAVAATLELYKTASAGLRPTPMKSHYTFNLRDFSRVIEGMFFATPDTVSSGVAFTRLWAHEALRIFYDRLVDDGDRTWLLGTVRDIVRKQFGQDLDAVCQHLVAQAEAPVAVPAAAPTAPKAVQLTIEHVRALMWFDFGMAGAAAAAAASTGGGQASAPSKATVGYAEVLSIAGMAERMEACLADYNTQSKKPLDLVVFLFFLEHVSRICRILRMPGGHALLVGVGGSGRRCATRLAAFVSDCAVAEVELSKSYGVTEWRDDLKRIIKDAGTGVQPVVFMFADTQLKWEGMLEDVNAILNSGEVPGLFAMDERAEICEKLQPIARVAGLGRDASQQELYSFFVTRVKRNLHVVLCMSPVGDAFRDRLRKFPSLVNCCTIDWYTSWPKDALSAVAHKAVKPIGLDDALRSAVVDACQHFHRAAHSLSREFEQQMHRHNYVTPTSFLELLSTFRRALDAKRKEVSAARQRYLTGLGKLDFATTQVNEMQRELNALQPSLQQSQRETAELMAVIEKRLPSVEETRKTVAAETAIANAEAERVSAVRKECADDLAVAMPALDAALKALDTISPADISSVKSMARPPEVVKIVMAAVCVMLNEKPDRIADPAVPGKKIEDWWGPAKRVMGDMKFIDRLKNYDLNNIDPRIMTVIRKVYASQENFKPEIVIKSSSAAEGLCRWVLAMDQYERVAKEVAPKQAALAEAEAALEITMSELAKKQARLKAVQDELAELQRQLDAANRTKDDLARQVDLCSKKLTRAEQLLRGLGGEKVRWKAAAVELGARFTNLTGDTLLAAGMIAYLGAFTADFRSRALVDWLQRCTSLGIPCSASSAALAPEASDESGTPSEGAAMTGHAAFSLPTVLGDALTIRRWQIDGLPTDAYSTESAIICSMSRRWPLMIDPQGQANKWVRNMEKANGLMVLKLTDPNFLRSMENAIQFGRPVLLENVGEELDPALEPILLRVVFKQGGVMCIRLGDTTIEYDDRFKLYITTKMANPHYLPETSTKVTLVNFLITPAGLTDQLLGIVVAEERPELQEQKNRLIVQNAETQRQLKEIENRILHVLSTSEGNILEDETAITALNTSKDLANEIAEKQRVAQQTEAAIDEARAGYTPVAQHASRMFFCIADMAAIDPMYQYSLDWFVRLFVLSIQQSERASELSARIGTLNSHVTYAVYRNVCRSLFEKDKLLFSFLLTLTIMDGRGEVDGSEYFFFLTGGIVTDHPHPNPAPAWLSDKSWGELVRLSALTAFDGLYRDVAATPAAWQRIYDSDSPHVETLPGRWGQMGSLTRLQKLLVLRCIRPDKLVAAMQDFITSQLGARFITPPAFDLKGCFDDSSPGQPLIFVLSPGSDPMAALLYFAESTGTRVYSISLGQGQGPIAEAMIERARIDGAWVVLQNCHLAVSWMPRLEMICEEIAAAEAASKDSKADVRMDADAERAAAPKPLHKDFRLWLTSYPSPTFPVAVLQNGVKMTNEPPHGLRENIKRSFLSDPISDPAFFTSVENSEFFRRLLFSLCFFHALIQERRYFGSLGFNIPYQFTESDLRISARQLAMFLDDRSMCALGNADTVPWAHLKYLTGETNYGGKITDERDRRALLSLLEVFYAKDALTPGVQLSGSHDFMTPPPAVASYADYLAFIDSMPAHSPCEVFGLHENAAITRDMGSALELLDAALTAMRSSSAAPGSGSAPASGGSTSAEAETPSAGPKHETTHVKTREETIMAVAGDILAKLAPDFDLEGVELKYPNIPSECMNTVLNQELARFNRLLVVIRTSMQDVQQAMKGAIVLSSALEAVATDLYLGRVPNLWKGRSYPSRKPLAGYVADLLKRLDFFQSWIDSGAPPSFWLPGFFFTQSFLTGVSQNFARKFVIPIDNLTFDVQMLPVAPSAVADLRAPTDGAYVYGMYLDGCRWDFDRGVLAESSPRVLYAPAPAMWMLPVRASDQREFQHYSCPMYRTLERRGVLSTTGHSTNHVMDIRMPSDQPADHWIRRGVALVLALDD